MDDVDDVAAALRRSERQLAAAQRITHCGSWELELLDLTDFNKCILHWSDEVFRIFGYEPGAVPVNNESFFRAVHPDDRDRILTAVTTAIETGTTYSLDHRVIRPDGSIRIVHEQSEIQYDADRRPVLMIGTVQDVTELRTTETQLVFADRMASVGTLAAGVAHEINNPLAAVVANLDLLALALPRLEGVDALSGYLDDARDGAERVRAIVRDLTVYSRSDDARREPVDVHRVLDSALRMATHELRPRARVVRAYEPVPAVVANESRLAQVFLNLLRNAAQAIPEGAPADQEIRVGCSVGPDGMVVVSIADTGCGIPPAARLRVFAPFFTTKPLGVGTGLGLSISQRIITDLGGQIEFDSEVGRGTTFRIVLPPTGATPAAPTQHAGRADRSHVARRTILVIDDEPFITTALRRLLDDHEVSVLNEVPPALAAIRGGKRYDLILCDLMMPGMTGIDLYRELAHIAPEQAARVVVMTGGAFTPEARAFLDGTSVPRVEKPFELDVLDNVIERIAVPY